MSHVISLSLVGSATPGCPERLLRKSEYFRDRAYVPQGLGQSHRELREEPAQLHKLFPEGFSRGTSYAAGAERMVPPEELLHENSGRLTQGH